MDPELEDIMRILRTKITMNKVAAITAIILAQTYGNDLQKQLVELNDAQEWITLEMNHIRERQREMWQSNGQ